MFTPFTASVSGKLSNVALKLLSLSRIFSCVVATPFLNSLTLTLCSFALACDRPLHSFDTVSFVVAGIIGVKVKDFLFVTVKPASMLPLVVALYQAPSSLMSFDASRPFSLTVYA